MSDYFHSLKINFSIQTVFGCRTFGPPENSRPNDFRPEKGCEIFVGQIPNRMSLEEIHQLFSQAGVIFKIWLYLNVDDTNKGYCFVTFLLPEFAERAVEMFHGYVHGRRLHVSLRRDYCKYCQMTLPRNEDRSLDVGVEYHFENIQSKKKNNSSVIKEIIETYMRDHAKNEFCQHLFTALVGTTSQSGILTPKSGLANLRKKDQHGYDPNIIFHKLFTSYHELSQNRATQSEAEYFKRLIFELNKTGDGLPAATASTSGALPAPAAACAPADYALDDDSALQAHSSLEQIWPFEDGFNLQLPILKANVKSNLNNAEEEEDEYSDSD